MKPGMINVGDVVQLNPEFHLGEKQGFFAACFMIVEELKQWGAQGVIFSPQGPRGVGPSRAYYRAKWEEMEYVGKAVWHMDRDGEEEDKSEQGGLEVSP